MPDFNNITGNDQSFCMGGRPTIVAGPPIMAQHCYDIILESRIAVNVAHLQKYCNHLVFAFLYCFRVTAKFNSLVTARNWNYL